MVARITTVAFQGTESRCIDVQVQVVSGAKQIFNVVRLANNFMLFQFEVRLS